MPVGVAAGEGIDRRLHVRLAGQHVERHGQPLDEETEVEVPRGVDRSVQLPQAIPSAGDVGPLDGAERREEPAEELEVDVTRRASHPTDLLRELDPAVVRGRIPHGDELGTQRAAEQLWIPDASRQLLRSREQFETTVAIAVEREVFGERRHDPHLARIGVVEEIECVLAQFDRPRLGATGGGEEAAGEDGRQRGVGHQVGISQLARQTARLLDHRDEVGVAEGTPAQAEAEACPCLETGLGAGRAPREVEHLLEPVGRRLVRQCLEVASGGELEVDVALRLLAGEEPVVGQFIVMTAAERLDRLGDPAVREGAAGRAHPVEQRRTDDRVRERVPTGADLVDQRDPLDLLELLEHLLRRTAGHLGYQIEVERQADHRSSGQSSSASWERRPSRWPTTSRTESGIGSRSPRPTVTRRSSCPVVAR